tara:strand:- start:1 stop:261 length:261 start_codon:yes stop_codon:yes gene_type:complete
LNNKLVSKEEHIVNFIKSFVEIENSMEPYKEQRKDLRQSYYENDWLSRDDMRMAVRAYRLVKQDTDINELTDFYNNLKKTVRGTNV